MQMRRRSPLLSAGCIHLRYSLVRQRAKKTIMQSWRPARLRRPFKSCHIAGRRKRPASIRQRSAITPARRREVLKYPRRSLPLLVRATSLAGDAVAATARIKAAVKTPFSLSASIARAGGLSITASGMVGQTATSRSEIVFGRPAEKWRIASTVIVEIAALVPFREKTRLEPR